MAQHQTFTKIVENKKDYVGMVAYTIYKNEKLNWIEQYKLRHAGQEPTNDVLREHFNIDTDSDTKVASYRTQAETLLNEWLDETLGEEISTYKETVKEEAIIKTVTPKFWDGVWSNVLAGLIGAAIITLLSVLVWLVQIKNDPNYLKFLQQQAIEKATP